MKKITPFARINKYCFDKNIFKALGDAEKFIKKNGAPDNITIANILYTMDEYDLDGKIITYYNKRTGNGLEVRTANRYKNGFGDAELELIENIGCWRDDITYLD